MLITLRGGPWVPAGKVTGTVGLSKVVVISYTGTGLLGFVLQYLSVADWITLGGIDIKNTHVSALTSQMTERRRVGEERVSELTKGGIFAER